MSSLLALGDDIADPGGTHGDLSIRRPNVYDTDLAYIHDAGFSAFVERIAPVLVALLRRHAIRSGRVVDAGCGSGRLVRHLVDAGYSVVGFDRSPAMIRLARRAVPEARFQVASLATAPIPPCRAVLATNEVVSYVADRRGLSKLEAFFRRVHRALPPGGLLVFDFITSAERRTYAGKSRSGRDWAIAVRATLDRHRRILTREITTFRKVGTVYRKRHETHRVRLYGRDEIVGALVAAGFEATLRRSYDGVTLLPGDLAVIARKPVGVTRGRRASSPR